MISKTETRNVDPSKATDKFISPFVNNQRKISILEIQQ